MSFYDYYQQFKDLDIKQYFQQVSNGDIEAILDQEEIDYQDFLALLSPTATNYLEELAQQAHQKTVQYFGKTMKLYAPLYLANYCVNSCVYCSFNTTNDLARQKLTTEEIRQEAEMIADKGIEHLLILTGESRSETPVSYIAQAVEILTEYFSSIAIEIYPLEQEEYEQLIASGVDGLTIYQETYNQEVYDQVHLSGPKTDYRYRLEAPERGCQAGMRAVNIGPLFGLNEWRKEAFLAGLHAQYLQDQFLETQISLSMPRLKGHLGDFKPDSIVNDNNLVQLIVALRLFLPQLGLTLSTRESVELRNNLIPLGITKMSAESSTVVGGYATNKGVGQFDTADNRTVAEIKDLLIESGYQPILKDWHSLVGRAR